MVGEMRYNIAFLFYLGVGVRGAAIIPFIQSLVVSRSWRLHVRAVSIMTLLKTFKYFYMGPKHDSRVSGRM